MLLRIFRIIIIALCVLLEQGAKFFLAEKLTFSYNTGMAFSLFSGEPEIILIFSGISCAILILACLFFNLNFYYSLGISIMTGGALSNFLERFFYGHVIDWIALPPELSTPFNFLGINFNLADVEICLGALIIILSSMKQDAKS